LAVLWLAVSVVHAALPRAPGRGTRAVRRFALVVLPIAAGYNLLMAHSGATVLVRLPASWPLVGGPLTAEALAYGFLVGLQLVVLFAVFAAFRDALSARDLVRLVPRAFGPLALVAGIALTYVPSTLDQLAAVREAQAVRGHRVRGLRDWLPLAVPLLVGGLERATSLAETMCARGLVPPAAVPARVRLAMVGGLLAVLAGWLGGVTAALPAPWPSAAALAGAAAVATALVRLGRARSVTSLHPARLSARDVAVGAAAWLPLAAGLLVPPAAAGAAYSPYPVLAAPDLDAWLVVSMLALALPALAHPGRRSAAPEAPARTVEHAAGPARPIVRQP
jgi:energy-coupling factor transport system permease protein